jgi:hypothetical protein
MIMEEDPGQLPDDHESHEEEASVKSECPSSEQVFQGISEVVNDMHVLKQDIKDIKLMCKTILKGIKNMKQHRDAHPLQPNFPPPHQDVSADAVPPSGNEFPGMPPIPPPPEATSRDQVHGSWDSWLGSNSWGWPQTTSGPGPSWSRDEPATWSDPRMIIGLTISESTMNDQISKKVMR